MQEAVAAQVVRPESIWNDYVELSKARLSALVVVTTFVGYLLAATGPIDYMTLFFTLIGTALAAAGANSFNQLYEIQRDANMIRTQNRPLPAGRMSRAHALIWALSSSTAGVAILGFSVNAITAWLCLANVLIYVLIYTPLKAKSSLCTLVGAVCGAIPPMMGWTAVTGHLGYGAWLLGAILFVWQIPHFLSLAWLYREDYERGGYKMLPLIDPTGRMTCQVILLYCIALIPLGVACSLSGISGWLNMLGSSVVGACFLYLGIKLYRQRTDANARILFFASLIYLPIVMGLLVADKYSPSFNLLPTARAETIVVEQHVEAVIEMPIHVDFLQ